MILVGGSASKKLSANLAKELGVEMAGLETERFPDEECKVQIKTDLTGEDVILVQNTYPDPNVIELFLIQDAVREYDVKKLVIVIPYFGYARQDKKFKEGESISARALARRVQLQSDAVITVDLHKESTLEWFDIPARNVSAMPQIGKYLKQFRIDIVISPDEGAAPLAKRTAETMGCSWDYLVKTRIDSHTVKMAPKNLAVKDKRVAIVDDIIATGTTIITASGELKDQGCSAIFAACTHGLYTDGALPDLVGSFEKVISTDTLESDSSEVTTAPEIHNALKELL
jgi:ribose-phosphate pyrophosphokinase